MPTEMLPPQKYKIAHGVPQSIPAALTVSGLQKETKKTITVELSAHVPQ